MVCRDRVSSFYIWAADESVDAFFPSPAPVLKWSLLRNAQVCNVDADGCMSQESLCSPHTRA